MELQLRIGRYEFRLLWGKVKRERMRRSASAPRQPTERRRVMRPREEPIWLQEGYLTREEWLQARAKASEHPLVEPVIGK